MAKVNSVRIQSVVVNLSEPQIISMPSIFSLRPVFAYFPDEKTEGKFILRDMHKIPGAVYGGLGYLFMLVSPHITPYNRQFPPFEK